MNSKKSSPWIKLPEGRLGRASRLALMGARSGAGMLFGKKDAGAEQALEALSTLRGLAMKVGQMASYVDGLVPEEHRDKYGNALRALQAQAAHSPPDEVRARVEAELKAPIERLFAEWSDTPLASASIGQVHAARLHSGEEVAVKVQHPGIDKALLSDLDNASIVEGIVGIAMGNRIKSKDMLEVVRERFREELDYTLEAQRLQQFAALHAGDPQIVVPTFFAQHSSKRVLTTSLARGLSFEAACAAPEPERIAYCEAMWRFVFKAVLTRGLLAADPHPGNYIFQPEGRITFLDYGCVQPVHDVARSNALAVHRAALAHDDAAFADAVRRMVESRPGALEPTAIAYVREAFRALRESPFRMTREYAAGLLTRMKAMAKQSLSVPEAEFFTMPPDMLFVNRLQFGFYSVLARFDVEVDYARVEQSFLEEIV
jgi:predicted unusual protein kinase regulating ubiquinone biosynthesis (AarF/ABC1/UbiB family)